MIRMSQTEFLLNPFPVQSEYKDGTLYSIDHPFQVYDEHG